MTVYDLDDVRIRSAIELPLPVSRSQLWDVDVEWGSEIGLEEPQIGGVVAHDQEDGTWWYTITATDVDHRLRFRDCAEFVIADRTIVVRPIEGGRSDLVPVLIAGTVGALLLTLRGRTVVHASAVEVDGRALVFVGQSGQGKSTLAALMCDAGAGLITDDVLVLRDTQPPTCRGVTREIRLRPASASIATRRSVGGLRSTTDERTAWRPPRLATGAIEVGAFMLPLPTRSRSSVEIVPLSASEGLMTLLSCPRLNGWQRQRETEITFDVLSAIAGAVPSYAALIPWGPPFDATVVGQLTEIINDR